jgi:hypothetical protein
LGGAAVVRVQIGQRHLRHRQAALGRLAIPARLLGGIAGDVLPFFVHHAQVELIDDPAPGGFAILSSGFRMVDGYALADVVERAKLNSACRLPWRAALGY